MPSTVDICNLALSWLGGNLITSIDDDSTEAKLCKANINMCRDAVLEAADWSFAIHRAALIPTAAGPEFGTENQFSVPPKNLRIITVCEDEQNRRRVPWRKEGNHILCKRAKIYVRYIFREEDPSVYSPLFVQALAARMASDLAIPIVESRTLRNENWDLYRVKLREAKSSDGLQGKHDTIRSDNLQRARYHGSYAGGY